ncbi:LysR family transcriptional regulator [Prauserella flavalba]|uniref:HTH lysR-type domain-containing protein n=1 Tax=Prauserella flavalba TaxID=1477506 RepID=A0A318LEP4_9PSEU|nr:LysR family transcriptional regulator [Prauserella flavalba]PXY21492.1 hypothetical protein BA062_31775 [Prauserella flavalba]
MELRFVTAFIAVAEELSFTRAAARLSMASSPLSQQIQQLERDLGVRLFDRSTRHVELTPAGLAFLPEARRIIEDVERGRRMARHAHEGLTGRLAIGFTGSATYKLLPLVARDYRRRHPLVALELAGEMISQYQVAGLLNDSLDIGFLRPPIRESELATMTLRSDPFVAALPAAHPLAGRDTIDIAELADEDFVMYPGRFTSGVIERFLSACSDAGFTPKVVQEATETYTLMCLVAAEVGVALVPEPTTGLSMSGVVYRPLADPAPTIDLAAAWHPDHRSPVLDGFLQFLRERFTDHSRAAPE